MFLLLVAVITMLILLAFFSPIQEHYHWLKLVGIRNGVAELDVDYGVSLSVT